jgi:competence protein ComEA
MSELKNNPGIIAKSRGWQVVYISPERIEDYNACYRVYFEGGLIYPNAADHLGIPVNEIWISEGLREFEKYILYHEIKEIEYRARGYDGSTAHSKAKEDEKVFSGDPNWERLRTEINIASREVLADLAGIDEKTFRQITRNRPYYRMEDLRTVPSIDEEAYRSLKERSWSFYESQ